MTSTPELIARPSSGSLTKAHGVLQAWRGLPSFGALKDAVAVLLDREAADELARLLPIGDGIEPRGCPTPGACSCPGSRLPALVGEMETTEEERSALHNDHVSLRGSVLQRLLRDFARLVAHQLELARAVEQEKAEVARLQAEVAVASAIGVENAKLRRALEDRARELATATAAREAAEQAGLERAASYLEGVHYSYANIANHIRALLSAPEKGTTDV